MADLNLHAVLPAGLATQRGCMAHAWIVGPSGWGWRCSTLRQRPNEALHKPCWRSSLCGIPLKNCQSLQLHKLGSLHVVSHTVLH